MSTLPLIHIDLNPTMGALFVGILLGSILKVAVLCSSTRILDTLSLAMIAHGLYVYLISDYMDPLALAYMSCISGGAETWLNMPDFKALADAGNIMTSDAMIQLIILYTITTGLLPTLCEHTPRNSRTDCNDKGVAIRLNSRGSIRSRGAETEISAKFSSMRFRAGGDEPSATINSSTELDSVTDLPNPVEDGKIGGLMVAAM
ncbi:hypothetical protein POSPLADRAFT_1048101 [Postia placenta MAD-698-R-SB12]|uniref:Uncharacterized protein n=1 Tax=Postia placenta MAD-698-R-SB12 TaxID=670580 RepID=A0A1X6MWJ9_9APHY|nr:hypothetical protein POSPLADRAFT_1048101 [Postia placenta MAD-698-R-SB12]OSX60729.1 hypothetical protein POSPLADRAFT_1048101 [Postia placenta MAD-698-R-SB12]